MDAGLQSVGSRQLLQTDVGTLLQNVAGTLGQGIQAVGPIAAGGLMVANQTAIQAVESVGPDNINTTASDVSGQRQGGLSACTSIREQHACRQLPSPPAARRPTRTACPTSHCAQRHLHAACDTTLPHLCCPTPPTSHICDDATKQNPVANAIGAALAAIGSAATNVANAATSIVANNGTNVMDRCGTGKGCACLGSRGAGPSRQAHAHVVMWGTALHPHHTCS